MDSDTEAAATGRQNRAVPALGRRLPRRFFARPCPLVARELLGCIVVRRLPDTETLVARIVEVEAYLGDGSDPGSHSHNGQTPRNTSMFGPPGRLYAYRSYGIHTCVNVVAEAEGSGAAVLIRALEPLRGHAAMRRLRGLHAAASPRLLARGAGRTAEALGLGLQDDGISLLAPPITLHPADGARLRAAGLLQGPRTGLTRGTDLPYRFYLEGCPYVSAWRPGRPRRTGAPRGANAGGALDSERTEATETGP